MLLTHNSSIYALMVHYPDDRTDDIVAVFIDRNLAEQTKRKYNLLYGGNYHINDNGDLDWANLYINRSNENYDEMYEDGKYYTVDFAPLRLKEEQND